MNKEKNAPFYIKKCCVCNELKIIGIECLSCKVDDILNTYNNKIIEMNNKIISQNNLLQNGVVVPTEDYIEMVEAIRSLVSDIETPYRLGLEANDRINPNWESLNRAKKLVLKWDND